MLKTARCVFASENTSHAITDALRAIKIDVSILIGDWYESQIICDSRSGSADFDSADSDSGSGSDCGSADSAGSDYGFP